MSHKVIVCVECEVWICLGKNAFRNGRLQMDNAVYTCTNKNTPGTGILYPLLVHHLMRHHCVCMSF